MDAVEATATAALVAVVGPAVLDALGDPEAVRVAPEAEAEASALLGDALLLSALLGRLHVAEETGRLAYVPSDDSTAFADEEDDEPGALPPRVVARVTTSGETRSVTMAEAVEDLRVREIVTADEFYALDEAARFRAFTVSRVACSDVLASVRDALASGLDAGATPGEVQAAAEAALAKAGAAPLSDWHLELVVRNNSAEAYSVGRAEQQAALGDDLEALAFVGFPDGRQSDVCRQYNGLVAPASDPVWAYAQPPNHHLCRSLTRAIVRGFETVTLSTASEIEAMGMPSDHGAGEGWDAAARDVTDLKAVPEGVDARAVEYDIDLPSEQKFIPSRPSLTGTTT